MSRQLIELEHLLKTLISEHEKLLSQVEIQQRAMKSLDLKALEDSSNQQEAIRLRITSLEQRRKTLVGLIALSLRTPNQPNLAILAESLPPPFKTNLLALRTRLRELMTAISNHTHVGARVAGALLGHLNTAVRCLAGAVEQAGLYTKHGTPNVSQRIGLIEAVG